MTFRQMLPFLFLNVIVSAAVVLGILFWWERREPETAAVAATVAAVEAVGFAPSAATPGGEVIGFVSSPNDAPAETPEAAADGPPTHVVQAGETLGIISNTYDVSIDDIMEANGLTNPDVISVGQQLLIPVDGVPVEPVDEAADVEPTAALPSPIPTEAITSEGTADIEVAAVESPGDLATEAVQIINAGTSEQPLLGWKVRDEDNNVYTFGQVSIFGEGAGLRLHTRAGNNGPTDLFWGLSEPAWRSGELLTLWDADDQVVVSFTIP